jgi:phenylpropionate dioxygenase-like ring-hydroxylating dioxygenase large terminal subunit
MVETLPRASETLVAQEEETNREAYNASQIGPFDYCPKLGFREYWYPAVWKKEIGKRPVNLKMLGDELVLFNGKDGKVSALSDWCPHRGARLSRGYCDFEGTVTCPYHGYVFDDTGQCVAGLIESPKSPLAPKMRVKNYPTAEWEGIVFVWMGETEPVPLEEDLPWEFLDSTLSGRKFTRVKEWESNWTEPVCQAIDYHEYYLHRGPVNFWRLFHYKLPFLRPKPVYTGGVKITEEGDNYVKMRQGDIHFGHAEYEGLGKWPKRGWWRKLGSPKRFSPEKAWAGYDHHVQLPSKVGVPGGAHQHIRWGVPMDEANTRMWTFNVVKNANTIVGRAWQSVWYYLWRKPGVVVSVNELEDLVVFKAERINLELPQKLGILDIGVIYFRRHLARRSRDFQRLGGAHGCLKQPPDPARVAEKVGTP